jgi:hypothetical protein
VQVKLKKGLTWGITFELREADNVEESAPLSPAAGRNPLSKTRSYLQK